ncbi:glycosyltransferase, partial [candidate division WOR-3 bacterium]|nr:glycosyltransferase [candidate division WOR-3 bacterium]
VATNMGGPVEIIDNGIDGVLVPSGDEKAIADACIKLLENRSLAKKIGERARMKVKRRFTAKKMSEKMVSIFESIMRG